MGLALMGGVRVTLDRSSFTMLSLTVGLILVAFLAAILGFGGIAGTAAGLAKIAFFVFLVLAVLSFVSGRRVA